MPVGTPGTAKRDDEKITAVISGAAAGKLTGRSAAWITRLSTAGWIPRVEGGYRIVDVVRGLMKYRDDEDRRVTKSAGAARLNELRIRKLELANAEKTRELIPLDDAESVIDTLCGFVRTELGALPQRVTRELVEQRRLEAEVDGCLSRIADKLREQAAILKNGEI